MTPTLFDPFYQSSGICTDTRKIQKDCLFICIKGENFDGNTFASKALEQGAIHVIVDNENFYVDNGKMTLVENSVIYLQLLANYHRKKFDIPVIGITGSNGKTTTKELIHAVLSKKYNVLATIGNLNNHLGVPFTLLRLNTSHEIAIIEMGANRFKDIEELCTIAEPDYGIITNIGKAHLEGFINFEGVLKTKTELYTAVSKNKGTIIVNADDSVLTDNLPAGTRTITYGISSGEVMGKLTSLSPFVEMQWSHETYESPVLETKLVGKYNFYNFLAAITFGITFKVDQKDISDAITEYTPTNNRSQVKETGTNTLILDCYNANPTSTTSALESFALNTSPDKLFILGAMKELGNETEAEHRKIIDLAASLNIKGYVVGEEFADIQSPGILQHFKTTEDIIDYIQKHPLKGSLILLKGSRSVGLEKLEEYL